MFTFILYFLHKYYIIRIYNIGIYFHFTLEGGIRMYESTTELAENKLLVLFIIKTVKFPISNSQLTDIVLENGFINYFVLQQYISELISSKFLTYKDINDKKLLSITEKGSNVLSFFKDRIPENKISSIEEYLKNKLEQIKKELTLSASYTVSEDSSFIVSLKALENETLLMDLKLSVASNKQAMDLCNKWKTSSAEIYNKIVHLLISD